MSNVITETNFNLPGQIGEVYRGKVGDVYTVHSDRHHDDLLVVVRTDRISAFDVVLPQAIPYKGQVLNQMSAALMQATTEHVPNWYIDSPDPNVTVGYKADPIKVEMIVRANLLGTAWRGYEAGNRDLCGNQLPDGMVEFQAFDVPLITPTTKAEAGHDENITPQEILERGLVLNEEEYEAIGSYALRLFQAGQEHAAERGLVLADTKYEFGRNKHGFEFLIDEAHTPDSSRYFYKEQLDDYLSGQTEERPEQLSKEFVREWLKAHGFVGEPGQVAPDLPDNFVREVSQKYIKLYETILDLGFAPADGSRDPLDRVESNIVEFLS